MSFTITPITTPFVLNITVNCYLIRTENEFILIDTGRHANFRVIDEVMTKAGCTAANLRLIVLTHGDFDHCGNAAALRTKYGAPIALHEADLGMVQHGDMLWNRKQPNVVMKTIMRSLFRLHPNHRFTPDFFMCEGDRLSDHGFDAEVIELPGHSKGSVGLLTAEGDLFCGDLLGNTSKPDLWSIIDDRAAALASVEKLKDRDIRTVYPGHGKPFPMAAFWQNQSMRETVSAGSFASPP